MNLSIQAPLRLREIYLAGWVFLISSIPTNASADYSPLGFCQNTSEMLSPRRIMMLKAQIAGRSVIPKKLIFLVEEKHIWDETADDPEMQNVSVVIRGDEETKPETELKKVERISDADPPRCNASEGCRITEIPVGEHRVLLDASKIKSSSVKPVPGSAVGVQAKVDF